MLAAADRRVARHAQEVDIRYVITSLKGSAQYFYENVYCQGGQMENLIKLHKAQLGRIRRQPQRSQSAAVCAAPALARVSVRH